MEGNPDSLFISGAPYCDGSFELLPDGTYGFDVDYGPVFGNGRNKLRYRVTVSDRHGPIQEAEYVYTLANKVDLSYREQEGQVTVTGELRYDERTVGDMRKATAYCTAEGCTFTVVPQAGYEFTGWFTDPDGTQPVSDERQYRFVPASAITLLYPRFAVVNPVRIYTDLETVALTCDKSFQTDKSDGCYIVPKGAGCSLNPLKAGYLLSEWNSEPDGSGTHITAPVPCKFKATADRSLYPVFAEPLRLDRAGTANCYIASQMPGCYVFDASIQGKGIATASVSPAIMKPASVRVLWETSEAAGGVIATAGLYGDDVVFSTGTEPGNALLGTFDRNGRLLWSWHIWVTATDPEATAQIYRGGRTMMDRNLGAMNPTDAGLFYQWGRKDPFRVIVPGNMVTHIPTRSNSEAGVGTEAFASANPGVFITSADDKDWMSVPNPNLWGNLTTGGVLNEYYAKSIYDPCPPG